MIRSEAEYQAALKKLDEDRDNLIHNRETLIAEGYTSEEVERGMEPLISFYAQLAEEVKWYENVRRRNFAPSSLLQIGRLLIGLRIANGLSQKELAARLGVSEAQVSRDERNEYHGVTIERAQRVLEALNETLTATVADVSTEPAPEHKATSIVVGSQ